MYPKTLASGKSRDCVPIHDQGQRMGSFGQFNWMKQVASSLAVAAFLIGCLASSYCRKSALRIQSHYESAAAKCSLRSLIDR